MNQHTPRIRRCLLPALVLGFSPIVLDVSVALAAPQPARTETTPRPSTPKGPAPDEVLAPPSLGELKASVIQWMESRQLEQPQLSETILPMWEFDGKPTPEQLLEALMRTFYLADTESRQLVDACRQWNYAPQLLYSKLPSADRDEKEPLLTNNVRYYLARHYTLLTAYNDALKIFEQTDPKYVVDPAGFLFYRAVCEQHLLLKEQGLKTLAALQNQTESVPVRYRKLAELMQSDLEQVQEKTLGEVARQMKDVERRLNLKQTDSSVQQVEEKIIATLDELIKKMEDQQQQQQSSASSGGGSSSGKTPQQQQQEAPNGGSMEAIPLSQTQGAGSKDHWGDLPPKAKEIAKNMLESDFPAHYRAAVEEYLKKLAERPAPSR